LRRDVGNPAEELEQFCGANDRVRNPGVLDQLLLHTPRAEVATLQETFDTHRGQRDMVRDASGGLVLEELARGGREALHGRRVLTVSRLRHIDHHRSASEDLGRRRNHLVAVVAQLRDES
jgi:hypothetical protein